MGAFSGVLDKVEAIERRLTAINDRLEKINTRIDRVENVLVSLRFADNPSPTGVSPRFDNSVYELKHLLYDYSGAEEREEVKRLVKRTAAQGKR